MSQKVLRLPRNEVGRDFVIGDIHFKSIDLYKGLVKLGFDKTIDRVIGVGDLIDRGPGVLDGLKLLGEPWFFTVQGNHEQMLINAYRENPSARYVAHGAGWWSTIADESKEMIVGKLESLPSVIEIESPRGLVGVVHADIPSGMSWVEFTRDISIPAFEEIALWGRERIKKHHREGVKGAWRVCTGHTWIPAPVRLGNVLALDCTGGGEGPLAIYCVQDDTIYVEGRPVSLDQADVVTELLEELEQTVGNLKATIHANRLIESQSLSQEADELTRRLNTTWLTLRSEIGESQKLLNALHGLSLLTEERRAAKLEELKFKHSGTQIEGLLSRLLD
ncbi:metallophosphoesterase [Pseudomonas sp. W2I6]|uniref:metallophosphoesterase n=1 Tax=Pseudomonas sp. W2I6 TaxID=3042289 RepID=UPI002787A669|nr:metallophosphoesterase [Pseudomonas sp. W2I6]MDQ0666695.1 serine/threonine protein phosphatase 1 [Pseudomonas sp. W2I6]